MKLPYVTLLNVVANPEGGACTNPVPGVAKRAPRFWNQANGVAAGVVAELPPPSQLISRRPLKIGPGLFPFIGRAYGIAEGIDDRLNGGGVDTGRRVGDELLREDCVGTMEEKGSSQDDEEEIRHRFTCVGLHTILLSRLEPITLLRKTPPEFAGSTGFQTESVTKNKF